MPSTDPITIYKGSDVTLSLTTSPVENITGWSTVLSVRSESGIVITKIGSIVDGESGTYSFDLSDDDTDDLAAGAYYYDTWRTDPGYERVMAIGGFYIADVVRDVS